MRWLLIALLVSLAAMLIAAAAMTLHILVQRAKIRYKAQSDTGKAPNGAPGSGEDTDSESEN
ncbi:MAG: hypothetical protein WCA21_17470 [Terracidiphilus sp.]